MAEPEVAKEPSLEKKEPEVVVKPPLKKEDYEALLTLIEQMQPTTKTINSARIIQKLEDLKNAVEGELKELVYQEYKQPS